VHSPDTATDDAIRASDVRSACSDPASSLRPGPVRSTTTSNIACRHSRTAPVVHGLQVLAFTAPGATLFPQYIGDVFIAFTSVSCKFLAEVHAGDTLYPQLEIIDLAPHGDAGQVTTRATIHNQHGQLVLDGEHTYLLKTAQQSTSQATS
jgi:acyl dehydratase